MAKIHIPRTPAERERLLDRRRALKMARSAHAYVRGSTERFYEWLTTHTREDVPDGPAIWICGDAHVGNLGPVARSDERVEIELRDFDQTVIGNPAHDLLRLGLSLAMAARSSDLPGVTTALMTEELVRAYEEILAAKGEGKSLDEERPAKPLRLLLREALRRSWKHLIDERVGEETHELPIGKRFWPLTKEERGAIDSLFELSSVHRLVTSLRCRPDEARVEVLDAAYWVKGCSSLGMWRAAVLVRVGEGEAKIDRGGLCLMDLKEATVSAAPHTSEEMPNHAGERVVQGARKLAPFLGERMLSETLLEKHIFVRELLPQDLKLELTKVTQEDARDVARFLARVVAIGHAGQMDSATARSWLKELRSRHSKKIDAPGWLWSGVVDLVAVHERAYLEHCRRHALASER